MAIQPGENFCNNLKKYVGKITLPGHEGLANHVMVFMLVGLRSRWKQVVGYFFTGDSIQHGTIKSILYNIIRRTESCGLHVHAVVSDCSGTNKRLWNDCGVQHARGKVLSNKPIPHPVDASRTLELLPDSVHVCKCMIQGWIANRIIELDEQVAYENGLFSRVADITHLQELVTYEQNCDLKMACGLKLEDVNFDRNSSNFEKMKVKNSTKYVNHGVAAALRVFAEETESVRKFKVFLGNQQQ
ncbi:uncharacterized protein LOC135708493 [Ochlerotatus camptorhynchus]|uniref:uncharacterized protein LOC135708493 n=1 Tax=Ochlerotatus camptorhynchus TaxID=644619 RepID=UPI0031D77F08